MSSITLDGYVSTRIASEVINRELLSIIFPPSATSPSPHRTFTTFITSCRSPPLWLHHHHLRPTPPPYTPTTHHHHNNTTKALLQQIIDSLHKEFDMTDLEVLNYFLGVSATRHSAGFFLSQKKYALRHFERAHMVACNPSWTPVDTEAKLGPDGVPVQDLTLYRSLVGGYIDADWTGCPSSRRLTFGYCVFLGDNLLSWPSKWQHTISHSSSEAKYRGVANVVAETTWIRNLLRELHSPLATDTLVYCDNVSVVYMSANPVQRQRTKHIEIDIHFVHDMITGGDVCVLHVPSRFQYADIFTQGLPSALFLRISFEFECSSFSCSNCCSPLFVVVLHYL
nr:ribonuclease H-like domain-containing protein [Tanacetum cinerariifolium]